MMAGSPVPSRVLYVTHRASSSPEEDWCAYLSAKGATVHLIGHPFPFKRPNASHWIVWKSGRQVRRVDLGFTVSWAPPILMYVKDVLINLASALMLGLKPFDLCISADPLNTCSLLLFRKVGLIRRLVHYTIDYAPRRFENRFMNSLYHSLDRLACYHSDAIWVLSPRMTVARGKNGVDLGRCAPALEVPMGADLSRIQVPEEPPLLRRLVYMGSLRENQGLELGVEVFAALKEGFPDLTWEIVGEGFLRPRLEARLKGLGVEASVVWHGFQPDHREVERILCRGGVGLALYEPSESTYTTFADPGKPKVYLACGLPPLITEVPAIAERIAASGAGKVVPYGKDAAVAALREWFLDPSALLESRKAALALAREFDWGRIFGKALENKAEVVK